MPDSDVFVYEHDFDDVDHAGTAWLEHDLHYDDGRYVHVGTYDAGNDHDRRVYFAVIQRLAADKRGDFNVSSPVVNGAWLRVVHRRIGRRAAPTP